MSGWSEHDAIPWRLSQGIAMRGRIVRVIAFGLHDPATDAIDQKRHTDKRAGHNIHVAGKEISAETGHGSDHYRGSRECVSKSRDRKAKIAEGYIREVRICL